nr:ADM_HP1_G0022040.mRNA.1.CDS.1 [Saccharomyces cerevisiae]
MHDIGILPVCDTNHDGHHTLYELQRIRNLPTSWLKFFLKAGEASDAIAIIVFQKSLPIVIIPWLGSCKRLRRNPRTENLVVEILYVLVDTTRSHAKRGWNLYRNNTQWVGHVIKTGFYTDAGSRARFMMACKRVTTIARRKNLAR